MTQFNAVSVVSSNPKHCTKECSVGEKIIIPITKFGIVRKYAISVTNSTTTVIALRKVSGQLFPLGLLR